MFPDKVLDDFKAFCANQDGRLKIFWNACLGLIKREEEDVEEEGENEEEEEQAYI